jgi:iron(III) transport system substrate-binding protein
MKKLLSALLLLLLATITGCSKKEKESGLSVTVYVSEDRVFSEPILKDFEKDTGIAVNAVYDTEESKSTGVMNRLIAEKGNPRADVYWANEPIRAEVLKQKGVSASFHPENARLIPDAFKDPKGYWSGFSARARVFIVNDGVRERPSHIMAYTDSANMKKSVIANPLFGTTTSHMAALGVIWGDKKIKDFMHSLKQNGVAVSTSNGESADFVAAGRYDFALVDSDDAVSRIRSKKPVSMIYPDQQAGAIGCFIVPNAVVLIKGAPHPKEAAILIEYLLSKETERKLAYADCAQIPLHPDVKIPPELKPIDKIKVMRVDYGDVAKKMIELQPFFKEWTGL